MKRRHFRGDKSSESSQSGISSQQEQDRIEYVSAKKIQSLFRGYIYRYHFSRMETENFAAIKIQKAWRKHLIEQRFQHLREIMALVTISRFISNYKRRLSRRKVLKGLQKFDTILSYYPSECKKPPPYKKRPPNWTKKSPLGRPIQMDKKKKKGGKGSRSDSIPKPMVAQKTTTSYKSGGKGPPRKRSILIELPPPWHGKDSRRLSQSQQDELIYNQKNDVQWVKNEILPLLIKKINGHLNYRDELIDKNEKFRQRPVMKPFIISFLRSSTHLTDTNPLSVTFLKETGLFAITLSKGAVYLRTISYNEDQLFKKDDFEDETPLFDLIISPRNGFIYGLDNKWCVRLINNGITVLSNQLNPEVTIPCAKKYLAIDRFGFLWVNLVPQKGDILGLDSLTLQVTIKVNLNNIAQTYRFFRKNLNLIVLSLKEPIGFAGVYEGMTDVILFPPDFGKARHLRHPNMKRFPCIRMSNNKLFVWSSDRVIYMYEVGSSIELIQLKGSFKVESNPVDVCMSNDPYLVYVSMDDCTLRAYLADNAQHELRLPLSKMTTLEKTFADSLLGPPTHTKSRPLFLQMQMHRFSSIANHIDSWSVSPKMALVMATFSNGTVQSVLFYNDSQQVNCDEFDRFKGVEPLNKLAPFVSEYKSEEPQFLKNRSDFLDIFNFLQKFDVVANKGQIQNLFQPKAQPFYIPKYVNTYNLKTFYLFLPQRQNGQLTAYEVFHYLKRSGILPDKLSEFSIFLSRLTPPTVHRTLLQETSYNIKMPVITSGLYNAVTNYIFTDQQVGEIIESINPLSQLRESLKVFTISSVSDNQKTPAEGQKGISTQRRWMSLYEKNELNRRLSSLILMEDLVKHELMRRVQRNIDEAFNKNMYDRMVPISSIDIHQHVDLNDMKNITFSDQPNRNPLLDNLMHKSVYHTWSTHTLFSRDRNIGVDLRAIHVPDSLFMHPSVQSHFEFVKKVAVASKRINSEVYAVADRIDDTSCVVFTEDSKALPLSHYLVIHSFLGANSRLILAARSICSRVLSLLYQLHKSGVILRTLIPDNILLNAQNGTVSIGNVFDSQQVATANSKAVYLPLPENFALYSNPFLPPEYFYEPPRKWTTAFDVWQFGILLLYLITGFLPSSYGTELMKHLDESQRLSLRRTVMTNSHQLADPHLFPQKNFFYDWLKGCPVLVQGDRKSWVGDNGVCYITTDRPVTASILELDYYHLLPYKNIKLKYDESRLFLEIIASCLQIDPEKRPTVEKLLRTIPFNQTNQVGDILDQYMRQPDSDIFVREFFLPTLDNLTDETFPFALGIISALVFHDEMADEDTAYSFPLDSRAAEKVTTSLFEVKFMDRLIIYVLKRIERKITHGDVKPSVTFSDEAFDSFLHLLERFVKAVEHGQGSLLNHVDEVVLTLLGLYTGNPRLRYSSEFFLEKSDQPLSLASTGSAAVFVFTHTRMKQIVSYAMNPSTYIFNTLKRTTEHNDSYFNKFLSFGEKAFIFANSMVHSIEKQRANAIYMLMNYWGSGQTTYVTRLFIDFRIPQLVIHCLLNSSCRVEANHFINQMFDSIKLKSFEPTYLLLQKMVSQPTIFLYCGMIIRSTVRDEIKGECLDLISAIINGDNAGDVVQLVASDVFWTLAENGKSPEIFNLLIETIYFSSRFVIQLIFSSSTLRRILKQCDIDFDQNFDFNFLNDSILSLGETIEVAKRLSATLFIRQSSLPIEVTKEPPPVELATSFLMNSIQLALNESEIASKSLDEKVLQSTRFDLKGTTYLKAKSTARETDFIEVREHIRELCDNLLHLFRCICFYCREPDSYYPKQLIEFVLNMIVSQTPICQSMPHPSFLVHHCIQQMALHCLIDLPETSPVHMAMMTMQEIYPKVMMNDIMFVMFCIDKDIVEAQLIARYPIERQIRMKIFQTIMLDKQTTNFIPILRFIVNDMLHNGVKFDGNTSLSKSFLYPIRSEALSMILFLFSIKEKYESIVKRLCDELILSNFVEEEKKLTDTSDDQEMGNSSIIFLRSITQFNTLIDEKNLKPAKQLLETLCMRYSREWMNVSALNGTTENAVINAPNSHAPSTTKKSGSKENSVSSMKKNKMLISSVKRQSQGQQLINNSLRRTIQTSLSQKRPNLLTSRSVMSSTTPRKSAQSLNSKGIKVTKTDNNRSLRSSLNTVKKESGKI
ncbi:hypothetical protein M9Y10_044349 [Tritrichomonas musculus]|uniref:non-specific serine/threonine protein kinase n=1 Tax=Tritrichomonas musculus TaxID=1915356 RepID=A0ABR2GNL5_9EUKA